MGFFDSIIGKIKSGVSNIIGKVGQGMDWVKNIAGKITGIPVLGGIIKDVVKSTPILSQVNDAFNRTHEAVKSGNLGNIINAGKDIYSSISGGGKS